MGLETSVTQISDLNSSWPLDADLRSEGGDHIRLIKTAVKSLLTNPGQVNFDVQLPNQVSDEVITLTQGVYTYTLAHTPSPASSVMITFNGLVLTQTNPQNNYPYFTVNGAAVTFVNVVFDAGSYARAWYRY